MELDAKTIDKARAKRADLEDTICDLIIDFEKEFGLSIERVSVHKDLVHGIQDEPISVTRFVALEVRL